MLGSYERDKEPTEDTIIKLLDANVLYELTLTDLLIECSVRRLSVVPAFRQSLCRWEMYNTAETKYEAIYLQLIAYAALIQEIIQQTELHIPATAGTVYHLPPV